MQKNILKRMKKQTNEWISLELSQPDFEVPVLVCQEGNENSIDICRLETKTISKGGTILNWLEGKEGYETYYLTPTHYMFLPEVIKMTQKTT